MKNESGIFNLLLNSKSSGLQIGLFNRARLWPKVFAGAGDRATLRNNYNNAGRKVTSEERSQVRAVVIRVSEAGSIAYVSVALSTNHIIIKPYGHTK